MNDLIQAPLSPKDQPVMFPTSLESTSGPLVVNISISLHRVPRQRCTGCGHRRVCFYVGLGDVIASKPLCAKCAGIR